MAAATGDDVAAMTVVPEIATGLDDRYAIRGETGGSEELDVDALPADARARLEQIDGEHAPAGAGCETITRHGTAYEQARDVAADLPASQTVMAANRPSPADHLVGPTTACVVRHAACTVTVVHG